MKKSLFILILILSSINLYSQDTLIYKDGKIKPVKIVSLDKELNLLKYEVDSKIFIVDINTLRDYKLHSILEETNVIETSVNNRVLMEVNQKFLVNIHIVD